MRAKPDFLWRIYMKFKSFSNHHRELTYFALEGVVGVNTTDVLAAF
jgi:hypothetical protein